MPFIKVISDSGPIYILAGDVRIIAAAKVHDGKEWVDRTQLTLLAGDSQETYTVMESADEVYEKVKAALDKRTDLWHEGMQEGA